MLGAEPALERHRQRAWVRQLAEDIADRELCLPWICERSMPGNPEHPEGRWPLVHGAHRLSYDDLRQSLQQPAYAFEWGKLRRAVWDLEGKNAGRLLVLAQASRHLCATENAQQPGVGRMLLTLGAWLRQEWRAEPPLEGSLRAWSVCATRRYDLCPRPWREVGAWGL